MRTGKEGYVTVPNFVDYRKKVKRHSWRNFPVASYNGKKGIEAKTDIAIHHSLTKQGLSGSNAYGYSRYHVETHGWPSIGYNYVIEPNGQIKWTNGIELRTYHVGNHNDYAVGIVLTGDFRTEEPTKEQKQSLRYLVKALQKKYPNLKNVKGHNEYKGYEWKRCPEFDYKAVLAEKDEKKKDANKAKDLPNEYTVQSGDTYWSIAKGLENVSVDDLIAANPDKRPENLVPGDKIKLKPSKVKNEKGTKEKSPYKGNSIVDYLNHNGIDSSFSNRKKLAKKHGIYNYRGTPTQNIKLLKLLQGQKDVVKEKPISMDSIVPYPGKVLKVGSRGKDVKRVQRAVGVKADGIFGPRTKNAVENYQRRMGLQVDGIVGPKTWSVMF